jgi:RNA polymerase sigma-70 factor (ECF subfamily)
VVRNAYRKSLRRDRPLPFATVGEVPEPCDEGALEKMIDAESVQAALAELPEEFRAAVILFYFDDFSYKQIADILEVPIGTVMSRLSRGKTYLRQRLAALYLEAPAKTV